MSRGAARGGVIRGRLTVDAARAVAKLREYQLADPDAWLQEGIRAAVAMKGREIRTWGDADEVWLRWEGAPIEAAALTRLFDALVNPVSASERGLRLLATGVNAALAGPVRSVRVYSLDGDKVHAATYTPGLLTDLDGDGKAALAELELEEPGRPESGPARGVLVHLKRRLSGKVLKSFVTGAEPSELSALRAAADDCGVRIHIGDGYVERAKSSRDLMRLELGEGLDGFLALTRFDPRDAAVPDYAKLDVAELGVRIVRRGVNLLGVDPPGARPPLRLLIDGERMPTNAARSNVRVDESPLREAIERADELLPTLVERLVARLAEDAPEQAELRRAALGLVATCIGGSSFLTALDRLPAALTPLLEAPLCMNAAGSPCSLRDLSRGPGVIYEGEEPVAEELADLVDDVLWLPPGDAARCLLAGTPATPADEVIEAAYHKRAARMAWLERTRPNPPLEVGGTELVRGTFDNLDGAGDVRLPTGVRVKIALTDAPTGVVTLLSEERVLGRTEWAGVGLSAQVSHRDLEPDGRYERPVENQAFHQALLWTRICAALLCEEAVKGHEEEVDGQLWPHVRAALANALRARSNLTHAATGLLRQAAAGPLRRAKVWPTGAGTQSAQELLSVLLAGRYLVVAPAGTELKLPKNALAVWLPPEEGVHVEALARTLEKRKAERVLRYVDRPHAGPSVIRERLGHEAARAGMVSIEVDEGVRRGAIAWGVPRGVLVRSHHGTTLDQKTYDAALGPAMLWVDDDRYLPDSGWSRVALGGDQGGLEEWERALARAVVDSLLGESVPTLWTKNGRPVEAQGAILNRLLEALGAADSARELLGEERYRALLDVPLLPTLGGGTISLEEWRRRAAGGALPFVEGEAGVAVPDFFPAILSEEQAQAAGRVLGSAVRDAAEELKKRRFKARRDAALAGFLALAPQPMPAPPADHVKLDSRGFSGWCGLAEGVTRGVDVWVEGRLGTQLHPPEGLPLKCVLEVATKDVHWGKDRPYEAIERDARGALEGAAVTLLAQLAEASPSGFWARPEARELLFALCLGRRMPKKLRQRLSSIPFLPAVGGGHLSVDDAIHKGRLRTAFFDGEWLPPAEGRKASVLDRPTLRLPTAEARDVFGSADDQWVGVRNASLPFAQAYRELLEALAGDASLLDSSAAARKLQARRRVRTGKVERPRLRIAEPAYSREFSELGGLGRDLINSLGPGVVGFTPGATARLRVFDGGVESFVLIGECRPGLEVAIEAPALARRLGERPAAEATAAQLRVLAPDERPEMTRALGGSARGAVERAARALARALQAGLRERMPAWLEAQLLSGLLFGVLEDSVDDLPLIETVGGPRLSMSQLKKVSSPDAPIWYSTLGAGQVGSHAHDGPMLRLEPAEAKALGERLPLFDATNTLVERRAIEAIEAGQPEDTTKLRPEEREAVITVTVGDLGGPEGHVLAAPLSPEHFGLRQVRLFRKGRYAGSLEDPCFWPTLAMIDMPDMVPREYLSDELTQILTSRLRTLSDQAFREFARAPEDARLSRAVAHDRGGNVRGVLWLQSDIEPGELRVEGVGFRVRTPMEGRERVRLPISGRLWVTDHTPRHAQEVAAEQAGLLARLLRDSMAQADASPSEPDAQRDTALLCALATGGVLTFAELPELPLPCVHPPATTTASLAEWARQSEQIEVVPPDAISTLEPDTRALVDDGSALSKVLIIHFGASSSTAPRAGLRAPEFVLAQQLTGLLRSAEVDASWLPVRPTPRHGTRVWIPGEGGALTLNTSAPLVRAVMEKVDRSGRVGVEAFALAVEALTMFIATLGVDRAGETAAMHYRKLLDAKV